MADLLWLPRAAHKRMPWKNGGGVSEQIAISPSDAEFGARFRWRSSFARVTSGGPFSMFTGYDRILAVWEGAGISLEKNGQRVELAPFTLFRFSGEEALSSALTHGPVTDFNVIYDRARVHAACDVVRVGGETVLETSAAERFLVCAQGGLEVGGYTLSAGDALRVPSHFAPTLAAERPAVLFDVRLT